MSKPLSNPTELTESSSGVDKKRGLIALGNRRLLSSILLAILLLLGLQYILTHLDELDAIKDVSPGWILLLFLLASGKFASQGFFTKIVVKDLGVELGFPEWLELAALSSMANALTPFQGGTAARAAYLKSRHGLPYSLFASTVAILYTVTFATSAVLGVIATVLIYFRFGLLQLSLIGLFGLCTVIPIAFLVFVNIPTTALHRFKVRSCRLASQKSGISKLIGRLIQTSLRITIGAKKVHASRQTTLRLIGLSLFNATLSLCMISVSFAAFENTLSLMASLVLSNLFMISSLIPLTPSGLGVGELALVLASQIFGVETSTSLLSAGLNRSVMLLSSLLWGLALSHLLDFRNASESQIEIDGVAPEQNPPQRSGKANHA